jgi:hypothetical protein
VDEVHDPHLLPLPEQQLVDENHERAREAERKEDPADRDRPLRSHHPAFSHHVVM